MTENHDVQQCTFTPEAATDEPASPFNPAPGAAVSRPLPPRDIDRFEFATDAEADACWAGVADGIRNSGGTPAPRLAARARDHYPELVATADDIRDRDILDFDPVSVRHRIDGWTPEKQREYVEALADSGVGRYAAARVGMSEQSANRLRRRPDAQFFNRACKAAMRIGARRLVSVAFERAIEGTVKRVYYHGEVRSEERVYDNRLLMALIGKLPSLFEEPGPAPVEQHWQPWMDAVEQGPPEPPSPEAKPEAPGRSDGAGTDAKDDFNGCEVWEDEGTWWTQFPPPAGFDGEEEGNYGTDDYRRTLSMAERRIIDGDLAVDRADLLARECARRDRYFGFAGGALESDFFSLTECELSEPFGAEAEGADAQAAMS